MPALRPPGPLGPDILSLPFPASFQLPLPPAAQTLRGTACVSGDPHTRGVVLMACSHPEDNLHSEDRGETDVKIPEDLWQGKPGEGAEQGRHQVLSSPHHRHRHTTPTHAYHHPLTPFPPHHQEHPHPTIPSPSPHHQPHHPHPLPPPTIPPPTTATTTTPPSPSHLFPTPLPPSPNTTTITTPPSPSRPPPSLPSSLLNPAPRARPGRTCCDHTVQKERALAASPSKFKL